MTLLQRDLFNSPYSGVFCATNDVLTLVPPGIPKDDMEYISEALDTRVEVITIGGSRVVGTLVAMNSRGILVSNIVTGSIPSGNHIVEFNGINLATGIYIIKMDAKSLVNSAIFSESNKILLLK